MPVRKTAIVRRRGITQALKFGSCTVRNTYVHAQRLGETWADRVIDIKKAGHKEGILKNMLLDVATLVHPRAHKKKPPVQKKVTGHTIPER